MIDLNNSIESSSSEDVSFERVREVPNQLWQKIYESEAFKIAFQVGVGIGTTVIYAAVILPASILLAAITVVGLLALGICSPALCHPTTAKIWGMAKNKLLGMATDLIYLPKAILVTPWAFEPNASRNQPGNVKPLVVFLHGLFHNKTCFDSLSKELQDWTAKMDDPHIPITEKDIYALNYGDPVTFEEIDHQSRFLATKLEQIRKERNLEKLDVILDCHSMGGLVAATFAVNYASDVGVNVLRIIPNGTPWHGTPMAYLALWAPCGREMIPGHPTQKTLAEKVDSIKHLIYPIATEGDTLVPLQSALGSELGLDPDHQIVLEFPFGHLAMLHSEQGREANIRLITEAWENGASLQNS